MVAVAGAALPAVAVASVGVGVNSSPIVLAKPATAGKSYRLGGVYVLNTGSEHTRYRLEVKRLPPIVKGTRDIPARWITFAKPRVALNAGKGILVGMRLKVPKTAKPGAYLSDVVATTIAKRGSGATAGIASATQLKFTVAKPKKAKKKKR